MSALARAGEALNPILVKEVRQALRGRYFRIVFLLALTVATMIGVLIVLGTAALPDVDTMMGHAFFSWQFGVLCAAVLGFVPFSAFTSTSAEWEENTYDLLVLSNLRPRQLVFGKLVSALTQAGLFYATFTPFVVFAFLLNGVDLLAIAIVLTTSFVFCVGLSLIGIALSTLARGNKYARVFLMALFAAGLVMGVFASATIASGVTRFPQTLRDPGTWAAYGAVLTIAATVAGFAFVAACARLAHAEENASAGLRVYVLAVLLVGLAWGGALAAELHDDGPLWGVLLGVLAASTLPLLFLATEPEGLGRRVRARVPRSLLRAQLVTPFLPGGGRGALFVLMYALVAWLGTAAIALGLGFSGDDLSGCLSVSFVALAFVASYVLVPSSLVPVLGRTASARAACRGAILVLWLVGLILPGVVGMLGGSNRWARLDHPLNPVVVLGHVAENDDVAWWVAWAAILAFLAVAASAYRIVLGVLDVQRASAARTLRDGRKRVEAEERNAVARP